MLSAAIPTTHVLFRLKAMTLQDGAPTTTVREIHPHTDQVM
jgi:hypothetical protein